MDSMPRRPRTWDNPLVPGDFGSTRRNESQGPQVMSNKFFVLGTSMYRKRNDGQPQKVIFNVSRREQVINEIHEDTGHRGQWVVQTAIQLGFYWPRMRRCTVPRIKLSYLSATKHQEDAYPCNSLTTSSLIQEGSCGPNEDAPSSWNELGGAMSRWCLRSNWRSGSSWGHLEALSSFLQGTNPLQIWCNQGSHYGQQTILTRSVWTLD